MTTPQEIEKFLRGVLDVIEQRVGQGVRDFARRERPPTVGQFFAQAEFHAKEKFGRHHQHGEHAGERGFAIGDLTVGFEESIDVALADS